MNTCGTCKFFGRALTHFDPEQLEYVESSYHECGLIAHKNRQVGDQPKTHTEEKALVVDGSGYFAALCVSEEFGCNQWSAKL